MFETYILPVLIFAGLGLLAGVLLTVVSKVFEVKTDERVSAVNDVLPQANCGACGFSGCSDYANAVVVNGVATNLCKAGGDECAKKIAEIMGVSAGDVEKKVAFVPCSGTEGHASKRFNYSGPKNCQAAMLFGGKSNMDCRFACIGLGNCANACQFGAMSIVDGVAKVDREKCVGCGACVDACPKKIVKLVPYDQHVLVACSSCDKGAAVMKVCDEGCIGCMKCEKVCPTGAIKVVDNLARIDYDKCVGCVACSENCPVGVIQRF